MLFRSEWWLGQTNDLTEECKRVNDKMQDDKSLRIRVGSSDRKSKGKKGTATTKEKIDLLGVKCPFNYVKTKIKLEAMELGSTLEVLLDDGEPAENVPRSVQNDGHKLLSLEKENRSEEHTSELQSH